MGERGLTDRARARKDQYMTETLTLAQTASLHGEDFRMYYLSDLLRRARARALVPPQLVGEAEDNGGVGLTQAQAGQVCGLSERGWRNFERGRLLRPDPRFVEHVAHKLGMTHAERDVLYRLAVNQPAPPLATYPSSRDVRELQPMLDSMGPTPALVADIAWNLLAWNQALAQDADPAALPDEARNSILWMFSPAAAERIPEVRSAYGQLVGRVRSTYLADGGRTPALQELVDRLLRIPEAAEHWNVGALTLDPACESCVHANPAFGSKLVRTISTRLPEQGLRLLVMVPDPTAP